MNGNKHYLHSTIISLTYPITLSIGMFVRLIWDVKEFGGIVGGFFAGYIFILIAKRFPSKRIHLISSLVFPMVISIIVVYTRPDLLITYIIALINYGLIINYYIKNPAEL